MEHNRQDTQNRTVAITFDDLPHMRGKILVDVAMAAETNLNILSSLKRFQAPATGFVVESYLRELGPTAASLLHGWNEGNFELANHGYSHRDANELDIEAIEQEIELGELTVGPMAHEAQRRLRAFRLPYNRLGETPAKQAAIYSLLERRGYFMAAATIDTSDYVFSDAFERAFRCGDRDMQNRIQTTFLEYTASQISYYADINYQALGFEPPAIMLLHINRLNAKTLDAQLELFRAAGYRFVSLTEAQAHPVYAKPLSKAVHLGLMWGYRWALDRSVKLDLRHAARPPQWICDYGA